MVDLFMQPKGDSTLIRAPNVSTKVKESKSEVFKCVKCVETFRTIVAKKKHEKFYHFFSKPFVCECGQKFGKLCEVNYHVRRVHNKEKNYVCNVCKKAFFKNSDLVIHQSVHGQSAKFICEDCGRRFKHVSNLIRHTRIHTGIKPYLCLPCNKRFSQVAALRQHETTEKHKEVVAEENKKKEGFNITTEQHKDALGCYLGETRKISESKDNSKAASGKRRWWFYCKICGERFPFSVLLRDHETKHAINKDIKCNSCKAEFSFIKDINNHACKLKTKLESELPKKVLEKDDVPRQEGNGKSLREETCMQNESEDFLNDKDKKVELTLTQNGQLMLDNDEVFLTVNDKVYGFLLINNDVTILENDDYLQILNAGKSEDLQDFTELESVFNFGNLHSDLTGEDDSINRFILPESWQWMEKSLPEEGETATESDTPGVKNSSEEKFIKKGNLGENFSIEKYQRPYHKTNHLQLTKIVQGQEYRCQECKKNFSWRSSLRNHIKKKHTKKNEYSCSRCGKIYCSTLLVQHHIKRDHLNIRSFKCTVCEKAFFRRYDLKVHIRIHTDERPYICGVCGKRFRHLSHSIRHDKTHSKNSSRGRENVNQKILSTNN